MCRELHIEGYSIMEKGALSIVFYERGKAELANIRTPDDVLRHSLRYSRGRWGVVIKPLIVGLCPTDQAGGNLDFPPGSTRSFDEVGSPAVPGHEFVGEILDATGECRTRLELKGIEIGDLVVADINVGCGECFNCKRGGPPLYCAQGPTFLGIGSSPGASWVKEQTGRSHLPGAYTEGFIVVPASRVYKIPFQGVGSTNLAIFSQTDAVACARTSWNAIGFERFMNSSNVRVLVIGAGRVGSWHVAVGKSLLPNATFYLADINKKNLNTVGKLFDIAEENRYFVSDTQSSYLKEALAFHFGAGCSFDIIIDAAGHGVLSGNTIMQMLFNSVENGGVFCTTAHTGIKGIDAGHPRLLMGMKRFVNGLSPQNNFGYALSFLGKHYKKFENFMVEIPGGLTDELAYIVETGGGKYKMEMDGVTFYSVVNSPLV